MTSLPRRNKRRSAKLQAITLVLLLALALPLASQPASAVTEYRFEIVPSTPTRLDLKGVSWTADGSGAIIIGGVQLVLEYETETGLARSIESGNWSTASQILEGVTHTADGRVFISSGRLDGSNVMGDLWELVDDTTILRASIEGDILQGVAASSTGRLLAISALGSLFEFIDGELVEIGSVGDVLLQDIVWAPDGSGAIIVGGAGTISWFDAVEDTLEPVSFTSTQSLNTVSWRPGTDDAWAAGEGGLVVEVNTTTGETARMRPYTPRTEDVSGISWHPTDDIALLVGEEGVAWLWRMGVFTKQMVDVNKYLLDVMWNPVGDEALVVGETSTLFRYAPRIPTQNRAPNAVITSPQDGLEVEEGTEITFDGTSSSDPEGDPLTFSWSSNATGLLGTESVFRAKLPLGTHVVTLHVDDGQDHSSTDQVTVTIVKPIPPEQRLHLEVLTPRSGSLLMGEVQITGTAHYELGDIASVEVSLDGEGWRPTVGTEIWSLSLDTSLIEDGVHSIVVRATAEDGVYKVESLLVEIRNAVVPEPPKVPNITMHLRDSGMVDQLIEFEVEGDNLTSWIVIWSFGDGSNGQGLQVLHAYREEGRYEVTMGLWLEGEDRPAAQFTATIVIESGEEDGLSLEAVMLLSLMAAGAIYVVGFYGGRRAFRRD